MRPPIEILDSTAESAYPHTWKLGPPFPSFWSVRRGRWCCWFGSSSFYVLILISISATCIVGGFWFCCCCCCVSAARRRRLPGAAAAASTLNLQQIQAPNLNAPPRRWRWWRWLGVEGRGRGGRSVVYAIGWLRVLLPGWLPSLIVPFSFSYDTTNMILLRQLLLCWLFLLVDHFALCVALSVETSATFIAAGVAKEFSSVQFQFLADFASNSTYTRDPRSGLALLTTWSRFICSPCIVVVLVFVAVAVAVCSGLNTPRVAAAVEAATATVAVAVTAPVAAAAPAVAAWNRSRCSWISFLLFRGSFGDRVFAISP